MLPYPRKLGITEKNSLRNYVKTILENWKMMELMPQIWRSSGMSDCVCFAVGWFKCQPSSQWKKTLKLWTPWEWPKGHEFNGFSEKKHYLGGGFQYFLCSPLFGEDFQFDSYFSNGLKPPTSYFSRDLFHQQFQGTIMWMVGLTSRDWGFHQWLMI